MKRRLHRMPGRLRYERAPDVCIVVRMILGAGVLDYIDPERIHCVRSWGSTSRAIARIYGLPKAWIVALGWNPGYVIEVLSEKYDMLPAREKVRVLIHELLHVPKTMGGGLRPHGRLVNERRVRSVERELARRGVLAEILEYLDSQD